MKKALAYYLSIFLSVLDFLGIAYSGYRILMHFLQKTTGTNATLNVIGSSGTEVAQSNYVIPLFVWEFIFVLGILLIPVLTTWRQKLRDDYEYDEHGNSKKHGKASQLSAAERKQLDLQKIADTERILSEGHMRRITHKGPEDIETALKELIGLLDIKRDIHEMEARMKYEQERWKDQHKKGKFKPVSASHMIFLGPAGTGKTSVARIMTGILYKYGYIRKNQCIEIDGNFFLGLSEGETAKKTDLILQRSLGGVLFIDEAYSLMYTSSGMEVLASIVKAMEDHRDDIVLIMAGYDNEMKKLINMNPGLESRIKKYMYFPKYSIEELKAIFLFMANKEGFCVDVEMIDKFAVRISKEARQANFGNARAVRNLLDRIIDKHATNIMDGILPPEKKYILMPEDMPVQKK